MLEVVVAIPTFRRPRSLARLLEALEKIPEVHRDVILFMMMSGCRPSEAVAIRCLSGLNCADHTPPVCFIGVADSL